MRRQLGEVWQPVPRAIPLPLTGTGPGPQDQRWGPLLGRSITRNEANFAAPTPTGTSRRRRQSRRGERAKQSQFLAPLGLGEGQRICRCRWYESCEARRPRQKSAGRVSTRVFGPISRASSVVPDFCRARQAKPICPEIWFQESRVSKPTPDTPPPDPWTFVRNKANFSQSNAKDKCFAGKEL